MIVESWLVSAAAGAGSQTAIEHREGSSTYAELHAAASEGATQLQREGVRAGERVAIALPAGPHFAVALHACWLLGATVVPIDLRLSKAERGAISDGVALLVEEPLKTGNFHTRGIAATHDLEAIAAVIHTSGTTSQPRPVELTFGNLLWSALGSATALGLDPRERWLCTLPLSHVGGLSILVRSAVYRTTAVLHERFETERALAAIMDEGVTLISVVATTLDRLLDAGLRRPPCLRCALAGGGPVPEALLRRAAQAGVPVSQTYGLTEACSQVSTVPIAALSSVAARGVPASSLGAGRPLFCTQVQIATGRSATGGGEAAAEEGEILVAGPTVARGATGSDGWLRTGDLGRLDEAGNLHLTGRKADTIISGGENVAPAEVEAVLEAHPQVAEAAVFGRSDPSWGEAVTAIVVPRRGQKPAEGELREHCAQRLASYKVPKQVRLIAGPLPRTPSGKLLRRQLK